MQSSLSHRDPRVRSRRKGHDLFVHLTTYPNRSFSSLVCKSPRDTELLIFASVVTCANLDAGTEIEYSRMQEDYQVTSSERCSSSLWRCSLPARSVSYGSDLVVQKRPKSFKPSLKMYELDFVGLVFLVIGLHAHQKHDHTLSALRLKIRDLFIFFSQVMLYC